MTNYQFSNFQKVTKIWQKAADDAPRDHFETKKLLINNFIYEKTRYNN